MTAPNPPQLKQKRQKQNIILGYECPSPKHLEFHNAWNQYGVRLFVGAYGTGKSWSCAFEVIDQLCNNPIYAGKTALVVAMTAHHARNQLWAQCFKKILENKDSKGNIKGMQEGRHYKIELAPQLKITFLHNQSTILFASAEQKQNLSAYSVSILYFEELEKADEEIWNLAQARVRGESVKGLVFASLNPETKSHWCYKRYWEKADKGIEVPGVWMGTVNLYDNKFLSPDDIKRAEDRYAYDSLEARRALHGEWISREGLCISNFNREKHVYNSKHYKIPDFAETMCGLDFGGGSGGKTDPTACVWVAKVHQDDGKPHYYVHREHVENTLTITQRAKKLTQHWGTMRKPTKYISDVYDETYNSYKEAGLKIQKAKKGKGSVQAGIDILQELFFSNRLFIEADCLKTIQELETYSFRKTGNTNQPEDKNNHCIDALRYLFFEWEGRSAIVSYTASDAKNEEIPELPPSPYISSPITSDPAIEYLSMNNRR